MALTCKWVTEETGALVMKWTRVDDEVPIIVPEMPRLEQSTKASATNDGLVTEVPNGAAKIWRVSASAYYLGRPAALSTSSSPPGFPSGNATTSSRLSCPALTTPLSA